MTDDAELLRRYSAERSEAAFGELVRRHVDLVYSAAFRRMAGNHHQAQEVTQMVFIDLARKAAALARHPVLPAWLHRSTSLAAAETRRREARRAKYERAAMAETVVTSASPESFDWLEVRPVLDEAIDRLAERDRAAIVLRFFGNQPFAEVGRRLGLSENAARMRVERALDKLKERLALRGIRSSAAALALGLSAQAVAAAPAGAAAAATAAALSASPSTVALLTFMKTSKLSLALLGSVLIVGTGALVLQQKAIGRLQSDVAGLRSSSTDLDSLKSENNRLALAVKEAQSLREATGDLPALMNEQKSLTARMSALVHQRIAAATSHKSVANEPAFDPSQLDKLPLPIAQVRPSYPYGMRLAGKSGTVWVDFTVDSTGAVQNATAAQSTEPGFEAAAIAAVNQWNYTAGQKNGAAVGAHLEVPVVFMLDNTPPPQASADPNAFVIMSSPATSAGPSDWFPSNGK